MPEFQILVIDDDPLLLETAAGLLEAAGHVVRQAPTARQGIALAQTQRPHLIVTDFDMPEMNGLALVQALQAEPSTRGIPIVAMTTATSDVASKLMKAGCIGYIPKPFDPDTFSALIGQFIAVTTGRARRSGEPRS